MLTIEKTIKQISGCTPDDIPAELLRSTEPLVFKGLVADWPVVKAGDQSIKEADHYLRDFYENATVGSFYGAPEINGRFFYNDDLTGFNFQSQRVKLDLVLDKIQQHQNDSRPPAVYVGSTTVDTCLPGFREKNNIPFNGLNPLMTIWLGNQSRIPAHYDLPDNLACCVVGRRKFTVFPPEQLRNLYIGPLDFTPAGQAISLVDFHQPDFDKFPKFSKALKSAQVADLEPGDAIFIPSMWWHHVEGLDKFNVLINYWWRQSPDYMGPPINVLNHALLAIRDLPAEQKKAWQGLFEHYIFNSDESLFDHIPEKTRGVLAPMDELTARKLRAQLLNKLNR